MGPKMNEFEIDDSWAQELLEQEGPGTLHNFPILTPSPEPTPRLVRPTPGSLTSNTLRPVVKDPTLARIGVSQPNTEHPPNGTMLKFPVPREVWEDPQLLLQAPADLDTFTARADARLAAYGIRKNDYALWKGEHQTLEMNRSVKPIVHRFWLPRFFLIGPIDPTPCNLATTTSPNNIIEIDDDEDKENHPPPPLPQLQHVHTTTGQTAHSHTKVSRCENLTTRMMFKPPPRLPHNPRNINIQRNQTRAVRDEIVDDFQDRDAEQSGTRAIRSIIPVWRPRDSIIDGFDDMEYISAYIRQRYN
ncbi:hypothetical protein BDW59DRAFT_162634 [Aspergillus cavernicola]|uniref:Uncharacterized protein n=1 Tax=Aspergillus cavernicola TaxID=176166 RepID=A0ABR4I981_9EURO